MIPFIDLNTQQEHIRHNLESRIRAVLDHGRYIMGPEVFELEGKLAEFTGSRHVIGCSSGTDALLMALMAYDVGPGDAILTTPFTFYATAEVIALLGATPVFVDIDPDTYNIDTKCLRQAAERIERDGKLNLKGMIPVDLFGICADYHRIAEVADEFSLFVLQDSAQAFGAEYDSRKAPTHGNIGATSFFPAKPLGAYGDAGAVFTDDDQLADVLKSIRIHGQGTDKYNNIRLGLNARLDTFQAAVLLEKLELYPEELERRQQVADWYTGRLAASFKVPTVPNGQTSAWAQYCIQLEDRDKIRQVLSDNEIPSMVYYERPLHLLGAFEKLGYREGSFPVAEAASKRILALPMHPYLTEEQVESICRVLLDQ